LNNNEQAYNKDFFWLLFFRLAKATELFQQSPLSLLSFIKSPYLILSFLLVYSYMSNHSCRTI
jgi:hypothetical protein